MKSSVLSAQTTVQTELGSVIDLHNYSAAFRPITGNFLYVYVVCYAAVNVNKLITSNPSFLHSGTITKSQQNLDEMNPCKNTDHKKYEWAATGPGVRY